MKYSFKNDYSEGAHPKILEALLRTNASCQAGYGADDFSQEAIALLTEKINHPKARIYLIAGGTLANLTIISAMLRPHESVIAAETGHICHHETGAIEATGHKVHAVPVTDGKLRVSDISSILAAHQNFPHQVKPRMVYISNATETGTHYNRKELNALFRYCKKNQLLLFMDGARLANALTAETSDLTLADISRLTDIFYLGGTKNGALIGEAVVICNPRLQNDFQFHMKQKGGLLAKGRVLGLQFTELLRDDLYLDLARYANAQAMRLKKAFQDKGIKFLADTFTNQIFPVLTHQQIQKLQSGYDFYIWKEMEGNRAAVRIVTSWATDAEAVSAMIREIENL